jgi:hypothetical protein
LACVGRIVTLHRAVGVAAILLTLPIAYHCILAYGVQTHIDRRVAVHSLAGCFVYPWRRSHRCS